MALEVTYKRAMSSQDSVLVAGTTSGAVGGGDLAAAASPYAILAPITVERTPSGAGRAAFEGDWSGGSWSCPPGAPLLNGDGWRCK